MQLTFDLSGGGERLSSIRKRLRTMFSSPPPKRTRLDPVSQLVRSSLGGRTRDRVSWAAFRRLQDRYAGWNDLAGASPDQVEVLITDVTFAPDKASRLVEALNQIRSRLGEMNLDFLASWPIEDALDWLKELPGVGLKVAASVLNFSTLDRRVMVVDTHVARVAHRLGVSRSPDPTVVYDALMAAAPEIWDAEDLRELHRLMKVLGQTLCVSGRPACRLCRLSPTCPSGSGGGGSGGSPPLSPWLNRGSGTSAFPASP